MSYTPPSNDAVDLSGSGGYTPPSNDAVDLSPLAQTTTVSESVTVTGAGSVPALSETGVASETSAVTGSASVPTVSETGTVFGSIAVAGSASVPTVSETSVTSESVTATITGSGTVNTTDSTTASESTTVAGSASVPTVSETGVASEATTVVGSASVPAARERVTAGSPTNPSGGDTFVYGARSQRDLPISVDISGIDEVTVEYLDGAGGVSSNVASGGAGGRVESVDIAVTGEETLYIWLSQSFSFNEGRYSPEITAAVAHPGGGSSEIAFVDTEFSDSPDEPFLVGAGGGGGGGGSDDRASDGARGNNAEGVPPPAGGTGGSPGNPGTDGDGAIASRPAVSGGTTIQGGGSGPDTDAEAKLAFSDFSPDAPTNLSATLEP